MEATIVNFLKEFGFPIFVAVWLLCVEMPKSRKAIEDLQATQRELLTWLKAKNGKSE